MRRLALLVALLLTTFSGRSFCVELVPIYTPAPRPYGVSIVDVRGDETKLYLWTSAHDLIAINKRQLLAGKPSIEYLPAARWDGEFFGRPTSAIEPFDSPAVDTGFHPVLWRAGTHRVHIRAAYCEEGAEKFHELMIDGLRVETGMDPCMTFTTPVLLDGKIWLGTYIQGEYSEGPGIGVLVFDLQRRQRVFQIRQALGLGESVLLLADAVLGGVWIVNRSAIHFYNREFQLLAKWYYSEQMDRAAKRWSVLELSKRPKLHDAFAVIGRIINTAPDAEGSSVSTKGISAYQDQVNLLPKKVRESFWLHYDEFERTLFPMWQKTYMEFGNGGNAFRPAWRVISCLQIHGQGGGSWDADKLVQSLTVATQPSSPGKDDTTPTAPEADQACPAF